MRDCCRIRAVDIAALLLIAVYALAALAGVLEISANGTELDSDLGMYAYITSGERHPESFSADPTAALHSHSFWNAARYLGALLTPGNEYAVGLLRAGALAVFVFYAGFYLLGRWLFGSPILAAVLSLVMGVTVWVGWGTFWGVTHSDPVPRVFFAALFPFLLWGGIAALRHVRARPLVMLAAGLWKRYILVPIAFAVLIGTYIFFHDPTRVARVTSFLRPEEVQSTSGYQLWNSLLAFGSGGWNGIGFMESRLKAKYLPEAHTDFILAIVGEELGLLAMLAVIVAYAVFAVCALKISLRSHSRLGMLLGFALTLGIVLQAAINMTVVIGVAPTKGMPAPFISYGGSNMMATLIAVGILVSIAADTAEPGYNERYRNSLRRKLSFLPWFRQYRDGE